MGLVDPLRLAAPTLLDAASELSAIVDRLHAAQLAERQRQLQERRARRELLELLAHVTHRDVVATADGVSLL